MDYSKYLDVLSNIVTQFGKNKKINVFTKYYTSVSDPEFVAEVICKYVSEYPWATIQDIWEELENKSHEHLVVGHTHKDWAEVIRAERMTEFDELVQVMGCPFEDLPLYINSAPIAKKILLYRMKNECAM